MSVDENAKAIRDREGGRIFELLEREVPELINARGSLRSKYFRLVEMADEAGALIAPNAPCKKGCSHCCKMAVGISSYEAELIAEHIGRGAERVTRLRLPQENIQRYAGVPCTFLNDDGTCSIYEVRPLACRTYHVVEDTADGCDVIKNFNGKVASLNMQAFELGGAAVMLECMFGDIRDFFPAERRK